MAWMRTPRCQRRGKRDIIALWRCTFNCASFFHANDLFARVVRYCEIKIPVSAFQGPRIGNNVLSEASVTHHENNSKMGQRVYTLSLIPIYPGPLQ